MSVSFSLLDPTKLRVLRFTSESSGALRHDLASEAEDATKLPLDCQGNCELHPVFPPQFKVYLEAYGLQISYGYILAGRVMER